MFFLIKLLGKWEDKQKEREMERQMQKMDFQCLNLIVDGVRKNSK